MAWPELIASIGGAAAGSPVMERARQARLDLGVIALSFASGCEQLSE
jgi:hypothetical protein